MDIAFNTFRERVLGCRLGKAVGGTSGGLREGYGAAPPATFGDPGGGETRSARGSDVQVVWLSAIRRHGLPADRRLLAQARLEHIRIASAAYGIATRNLAAGILPPASGAYDNPFAAGSGSATRSELWACLAPGDPALAAALALEDACVDHAGEGLYAEVFLAALGSAAFADGNRDVLLDRALATIPEDCRVSRAVSDTRRLWRETGDLGRVRERIAAAHGQPGDADAGPDPAFAVLGWLAGSDFGESVRIAAICGSDTGSSLGALLGILDPASVPLIAGAHPDPDPVLSPGIVGIEPPRSAGVFADLVADTASEVLHYYGSHVRIIGAPPGPEHSPMPPPRRPAPPRQQAADSNPRQAQLATEPLEVRLTYPPGIAMVPGHSEAVVVSVANPAARAVSSTLRVRLPDGWLCDPVLVGLRLQPGGCRPVTLTVTPPHGMRTRPSRGFLDLRFESDGLVRTVTAGLPLTVPWLRRALPTGSELPAAAPVPTEADERTEVVGHALPLPPGPCVYAVDVRLSRACRDCWVVRVPRRFRAWLDGECILDAAGDSPAPLGPGRGDAGSAVTWGAGWHRFVIAVGEGTGGELFAGIGGHCGEPVGDLGYRLAVPRNPHSPKQDRTSGSGDFLRRE